MKKPLLIVLTLAMLLSLCACGGGTNKDMSTTDAPPEEMELTKEESIEKLLISDKWVEVYTGLINITFADDGTAVWGKNSDGKWSLSDKMLTFSFNREGGDDLIFTIINYGDITLLECENKSYALSSDVDYIRPILRSEREETAPTLDYKDYLKTQSENTLRAKEKYDNQVFKYSGTVMSIEETKCSIGYVSTVGNVTEMEVYLNPNELIELSRGDTITFVGTFSYPSMLGFPPSMSAYIVE